MTHELKILRKYFDDLMFGDKNFEIRKNDRDYHVGDKLILKEYEPDLHIYTGNVITATINYIHYGNGEYGLAEGYCVMGLTEIECTLGKFVGGKAE